jgi:hypothetical protein
VKACRRRGDRAFLLRVHRLIAFAVLWRIAVRSFNVSGRGM